MGHDRIWENEDGTNDDKKESRSAVALVPLTTCSSGNQTT